MVHAYRRTDIQSNTHENTYKHSKGSHYDVNKPQLHFPNIVYSLFFLKSNPWWYAHSSKVGQTNFKRNPITPVCIHANHCSHQSSGTVHSNTVRHPVWRKIGQHLLIWMYWSSSSIT